MTHLDWIVYFKELVGNHTFLTPSGGNKHYFLGEFDEFFSQFRSKVVFPAFIMESSQLDVEMPAQQNLIRRTLAFMVVDKYTREDYGEIQQKMAACEQAGLDIIGRLQDDIRNSEMSEVRILDVHAEPCMNDPQHYCGWRFEFVVVDPVCMYRKNKFRDGNTSQLLQECGHGLYSENNEQILLEQ